MPLCGATQRLEKLPPGNATIFIHGTMFALVSPLANLGPIPEGLIPFSSCTNGYKRVGMALIASNPKQFTQQNFFYFGWNGELDFTERKQAAYLLYDTISEHTEPLTVIAHSHGCNVALYLAQIAEEKKNTTLKIDSLILLAAPVQNATAHLVHSPLFKQIISLYSTADLIQIADPQGVYTESKKVSVDKKLPLLSKRRFPHAPALKQARVLLDGHSPSHIDFIKPRFIKRLPELITLLAESSSQNEPVVITIPSQAAPYIAQGTEQKYVPRTKRNLVSKDRRAA